MLSDGDPFLKLDEIVQLITEPKDPDNADWRRRMVMSHRSGQLFTGAETGERYRVHLNLKWHGGFCLRLALLPNRNLMRLDRHRGKPHGQPDDTVVVHQRCHVHMLSEEGQGHRRLEADSAIICEDAPYESWYGAMDLLAAVAGLRGWANPGEQLELGMEVEA